MALSTHIRDREKDKFRESPDGYPEVRVARGVIETTAQSVTSSQSMASDFNTSSINASKFNSGTLTAVWSSANHSDATFVVEISDDETTWQQLGESGTALNADIPSGLQIWQITLFTARYLRLRFTANSNTAGSVDISFAGRS